MMRAASPTAVIQADHRYRSRLDRFNVSTTQAKDNPISVETRVPLYRYVHMNDEQNTQIFTFLLLPHLLCGLLNEVESNPFVYAEHLWTVRFLRSDTHLGLFLELKSFGSSLQEDQTTRKSTRKLSDQVQCATVSVDFQFTLKNREHFSRNETFDQTGCLFGREQPRFGKKKFLELTALSSKRYIYDDGKCVVELELKNPDVQYSLWFDVCPDPTASTYFERSMPSSSSMINLMRLDGSVVSVNKSMHFESERFIYAESQWYFTLDLEVTQIGSGDCNSKFQRNSLLLQEPEILVNAELSLVRKVTKSSDSRYRSGSTNPKRQHTVSRRVKCIATLPGGCHTRQMEFSIGSQGWPTQAHRVQFQTSSKDDVDHKATQDSRGCHSTSCSMSKAAGLKQSTDGKSAGSGSPVVLLLACASSPINVKLRMLAFTSVSFVEVPFDQVTAGAVPSYLLDPFYLPWHLQTSYSGRLLRLRFQSVSTQNRWEDGEPVCFPSPALGPYPTVPNAVCMIGCRLRIHPLTPQLHAQVLPVGPDLVQMIRFTSEVKRVSTWTAGDVMDEWDMCKLGASGSSHYDNTNSQTTLQTTESDIYTSGISSVAQRRCQWIPMESEDACEVAMNITVAEAGDKNTGLVNPLNGTILVEIEWVYYHVIHIDRFHSADLINARQYHQMRYELNRLRKERDELERQLMIKQMGLVQVDQGPRSMVPVESMHEVCSLEETRHPNRARTQSYGASSCPVRERHSSLEPRAPKRHSQAPAEYRDARRDSPSSYRENYGNPIDSFGRVETSWQEDTLGHYRGHARHSIDYESSFNDNSGVDNCGVKRNSVNSEFENSSLVNTNRLPDRRKQFSRSKTAWKTYECTRMQCPAEPSLPSSAVNQPFPPFWQKPVSRRVKQIGSGDLKSPTGSSICSPRNYSRNYDENAFFY